MPVHISKPFIAFALVLCLVMPFVSAAASVIVMAAHTHVCHDEEHKEYCADVRACCKICYDFDSAKNRTHAPCGTAANKGAEAPSPPLALAPVGYAFSCANFATLISLKVRLNN